MKKILLICAIVSTIVTVIASSIAVHAMLQRSKIERAELHHKISELIDATENELIGTNRSKALTELNQAKYDALIRVRSTNSKELMAAALTANAEDGKKRAEMNLIWADAMKDANPDFDSAQEKCDTIFRRRAEFWRNFPK